ncbi:MAG: hypothetical protein EON51_16820 [Acinetobacter sp.]|nr:MAG: hypothetical protein EON51_16820 [Acinetobacter sp.]
MFEEYKNEVVLYYQSRKELGKLSINLAELSPGKLRDECIIIYNERPLVEDNEMLRAFFGPLGNANIYNQLIDNVDIDKFRPLIQHLTGITSTTARKNIELLAWLIDFTPRPYEKWLIKPEVITDDGETTTTPEPTIPNEPPTKSKFKRPIVIVLLIAFLSFALYSYLNYGTNKVYTPANTKEKCMHWIGDSYEPISCADLTSKTPIVAIDFRKLNRFKKINTADTLTKYDLGSVWYAKRYGKAEFYTDSGTHPIDTNRALNPLSEYMLNKYVSPDRHLLNRAGWGAGIFALILALIGLVYRYEKRNKHYNELNK